MDKKHEDNGEVCPDTLTLHQQLMQVHLFKIHS